MNLLKLLIIVFLTSMASGSFANSADVDITRNLVNRELIYTKFFQVTKDMSDLRRRFAGELWKASCLKGKNSICGLYVKSIFGKYKKVVKNRDLLNLIAHYYYIDDLENFKNAVEFYYFSLSTFVWEFSKNPYYLSSDSHKKMAIDIVNQRPFKALKQIRSCLDANTKLVDGYQKIRALDEVKKTCLDNNKMIAQLLKFSRDLLSSEKRRGTLKYKGPGFVKSYAGYIEGNNVELLTQNPYHEGMIQYLGELQEKFNTTKNPVSGKKYVEMGVEDFKAVMKTPGDALSKLFTKEEGFPTDFDENADNFHQLFSSKVPHANQKNIFGEILKAIDSAQESVFIDVFFYGGTMGVYLSKKLIKKVQENPKLKVFIVTDMVNNLGYKKELDVAYNYIRAYAEKFPQSGITVLPANIYLKRTALPDFMDLLVNDNNLKHLMDSDALKEYAQQLSTYPNAKSDHSKVYIIDGKNPKKAVAFIGSKNLTDSSGSIAYDEMVKVQGPAALLIQDSYYYDLYEAMSLDMDKTTSATGSSSSADNKDKLIKNRLSFVDVMGRGGSNYLNKRFVAKKRGDTLLQIGQNNVYGTIRSPLAQDIDAILHAKKQIIISDQFVYEPQVVSALMYAASKSIARGRDLKIYIMMASLTDPRNLDKPFGHIPNNLLLEDLLSIKGRDGTPFMKIKWKKVPDSDAAALKAVAAANNALLAPEYHLKSISVDGIIDASQCQTSNPESTIEGLPTLISGSANKDNMTMSGGFREFQLVLFDKASTVKHDCLFWSRWNDPDNSIWAKPDDFKVPQSMTEKGITPRKLRHILRSIFLNGYNFDEKVL
ncbi:MAG: hypothetical protein ISR65_16985 [Bacteriovoracaceae bacterium]|nr:hypothetical protein [Bacteriovoracaceae bacterium]